ncbi:Uncharacterized conserved protein YlxW, UPF0749 family [Jatrophihabitans endophyticus]|uniref:Uncharacterized conserved protein YlxW, UPF0749 family n=1 Tax=Jatrophihabitans endophyticus TaxID=1206085 RepID=A0A1M5HXJ7_9ACTN|nr:DUF881 domain-containing protein [Jatrophihabitans endophyticus]SHG20731.1 Uncharacterized conserved protein YlxW, UPF0749 family [Jatrophihabitans endophyticus]
MRLPARIRRRDAWRVLVPVVCLAAGVGFAASARDSGGTDLRAPSVTSLAGTVRGAEDRVRVADERVRALQNEVNRLTADVGAGDSAVRRAQQRVAPLRVPGGLRAVRGPGVEVVLDDAPADTTDQGSGQTGDDAATANQKVVHQSDLQAVVNALWAGGAEAMTIAGQRVIATSAVRCVGNTLLLNGEVYSPPFRVAAIGPSRTMLERLDASDGVRTYKEAAGYYGLGYTVETTDAMTLPAYHGPLTLTYARPGR